jgi:pimeloyl-ACP methyl ester carboxylesterase
MASFVLVAGAWLGGWAWQPVARQLRDGGHDVYPVTLTGLGERAHLASSEVDLDTHVTDVVNLIEFEDLHEVVLVGHSYAGIVVTGVADRVPERIGRLVYLDSGPVPDGLAYLDTQSPEVRRYAERQVAEHGEGWLLPVPTFEELESVNGASLEGLGPEQRELMRSRSVGQPFGTYTTPLRLQNPARDALSKVLISSSFPLEVVRKLIADGHPWFKDLGGPEWQLLALPTGHWPMFSVPGELARLLDQLPAS